MKKFNFKIDGWENGDWEVKVYNHNYQNKFIAKSEHWEIKGIVHEETMGKYITAVGMRWGVDAREMWTKYEISESIQMYVEDKLEENYNETEPVFRNYVNNCLGKNFWKI